jgi:sugar-specific transcriptional regulator TrmB
VDDVFIFFLFLLKNVGKVYNTIYIANHTGGLVKNIMNSNKKIRYFLQSIGFTSSETKIYLNLLGRGPLNIGEISRSTKIPRTTTSRNIKKLVKKGVVSTVVKMHETLIEAESPDKLELILKEEEIKLEDKLSSINKKKKDFRKLLSFMSKKHQENQDIGNVLVKYYEGIKGVKNAYKLTTDSNAKEIFYLFKC